MMAVVRCLIVLMGLWLAMAGAAQAQRVMSPAERLDSWELLAGQIEAQIEDGFDDAERAEQWRADLGGKAIEARSLAEAERAKTAPLRAQLEALGPAPAEGETETEDVATLRASLRKELDTIEGRVRRAEAIIARANAVSDRIATLQRAQRTSGLMQRAPGLLSIGVWQLAATETVKSFLSMGQDIVTALTRDDTDDQLLNWLGRTGAALLFALVFGVLLRRALLRRIDAKIADEERTRFMRFLWASGGAMVRLILPLLAVLAVSAAVFSLNVLGGTGTQIVRAALTGVVILAGAYAFGNAFFSPGNQAVRIPDMTDRDAGRAMRATIGLAAIAAIDQIARALGEAFSWAETTQAIINLGAVLLASFFFALLARNVARKRQVVATPVSEGEGEPQESRGPGPRRIIRFIAYATALAAPIAALLGYVTLSRELIITMTGSGAILLVAAVFLTLIGEVVTVSVERADPTARAEDKEIRAWWINLLASTAIGLLAALAMALLWGASWQDVTQTTRKAFAGFEFAGQRISLGDMAFAVGVFIGGYWLTKLLQRQLRDRVLPRSRVEKGAQASIAAGFGYLGVLVTLLITVSTAGLDLSNLAIVAGALSVGLGFGLQTIVNNFVSGIILLIERPIRVGDWVVVGGQHGTVRRINVRSTEIECFDRSVLIVPNSELIANSVTNWTHNNNIGRIIIPVGVAYGSDLDKVRETLLTIAREEKRLLRFPAPDAPMRGFGDSALNFELRGFLRDVNQTLQVQNDLCFAIDRKFREAGIEMPFPQRDVHLRGLESLTVAPSPMASV